MNWIKRIKSRITMKRVRGLFYDRVNGDLVWMWIDCFGIRWMAQTKYGLRVLKPNQSLNSEIAERTTDSD